MVLPPYFKRKPYLLEIDAVILTNDILMFGIKWNKMGYVLIALEAV